MNSTNQGDERYWESFINVLPESVLILDLDGTILYANKCACSLFSKPVSKFIGNNFSYPLQSGRVIEIEIIKNDLATVCCELTIQAGKWKNQDAWIAVLHDITEKKSTEKALKIAANVFNFAKEGILITDSNNVIIDINKEFTKITGYEKKDVLGKTPKLLQSGQHNKNFYEAMWKHIKKTGYWYGEIWNRKKNGETYPQLLAISEVLDEDEVINYVGVFYDITQQEEQKRKLEHSAHYDSLTDLPNRVLLIINIENAIKETRRSNKNLAILFIDLDYFKTINDKYGHDIGDLLLIKFTEIIKKQTREIDTFARYGGDEFILVATNLDTPNEYKNLVERIYDQLRAPISVESYLINVKISIGVALYPQNSEVTPEQLIRQADHAMYESKISGRNKITVFNTKNEHQKKQDSKLIKELTDALHNDEFEIFYQPKVNMKTQTVFGAEGLIRWQHKERGLLLPGEFIPFVMKHPEFLLKLTEWTIKKALNQLSEWHTFSENLTISINIDAFQLEQKNFINQLKLLLKPYPENIYKRLEFEILESSFISNLDGTSKLIKQCNDIGIEFSLDDFGTGFSSINYLVALPFKYMKIDMNFIRNILGNKRDIKILKAILDIAKAINIDVIAEGVETQPHEDLLLKLGCNLGQGFVFSKALPAEDFKAWYQAWQPKQ